MLVRLASRVRLVCVRRGPAERETDLPCCFFEKAARERERFDVAVVRGTFDFGANGGEILFAEEQLPLVDSDEHEGPVETDPLAAVLATDRAI